MSNNDSNAKVSDEEYYTLKEAAEILKVTTQTISNYLRNNDLKGVKRGPKQKWHIIGTEIKRKMKEWNM